MVNYPDDWIEMKLSDVGYTYAGLTGKTKADFESGNGKFITFLNVLNNVKIDISILGRVNVSANERQNTVKVGDLFFNASSETPEEVGMSAALLDNPGVCYLNSFCFGYRLVRDDISPLFLAYYFNSRLGRELMRKLAQGSTRYNLSKQNFLEQSIPLPPLHEQQAIADTLSAFDTHITNLAELITKKKAIRDGALEDLMSGRTRLKGFSGDWEVKKLGEVGKWESGSTPSRNNPAYYKNGDIFWVKSGELNDSIVTRTDEKITHKALNESATKLKKSGAVVIAMYGATIGKLAILGVPATTNQACCVCEVYEDIYNKFLFYSLMFHREEIKSLSAGAAQPNISKAIITNYSISLPPLTEQQAIADTLSALDDEIASLEAERDKITQIHDGAMNDLLTGKVRLLNGN